MPASIHPAPPAATHAASLAPLVVVVCLLAVVLIAGTILLARR